MEALLSPLKFRPIFKEKVWGGNRLETVLGKTLDGRTSVGESWEISDHGEDLSVVADGPLAGRTLRDLLRTDSEDLVGCRTDRFPLLFKAIDASETLSVQVHPDDEHAARLEPGCSGKSEAWAVVHAEPGARIVHGLAPGVSMAAVFARLSGERGSALTIDEGVALDDVFGWRHVSRGDIVALPAGTIHAIGAGLVVVEVQQSSDITYRIHDWGRPRELHLSRARQVASECQKSPDVYPRWLPDRAGAEPPSPRWKVVDGDHFTIDAVFLRQGEQLKEAVPPEDRRRFGVLVGLDGVARLVTGGSGAACEVAVGDFFLLPARRGAVVLEALSGSFSGLWVSAELGPGQD